MNQTDDRNTQGQGAHYYIPPPSLRSRVNRMGVWIRSHKMFVAGVLVFAIGSAVCVAAFDRYINPATLDQRILLTRPLVLAGGLSGIVLGGAIALTSVFASERTRKWIRRRLWGENAVIAKLHRSGMGGRSVDLSFVKLCVLAAIVAAGIGGGVYFGLAAGQPRQEAPQWFKSYSGGDDYRWRRQIEPIYTPPRSDSRDWQRDMEIDSLRGDVNNLRRELNRQRWEGDLNRRYP